MSKHVFYVTAIIFLAIVCVVDYMRINKLQEELTDARKQIEEEFDAVEWKLGCIRDLGIAYWRYNFILKNCYFMGFFKRWETLVNN